MQLKGEPESALKAATAFLNHADRCWKAEEVNATRLAARSNLVLTAVTATLSIAVFGFGKALPTIFESPAGFKPTYFCTAFGLGSVFLVWALVAVLGIHRHQIMPPAHQADREDNEPTASGGLAYPDKTFPTIKSMTPVRATWVTGDLTYKAFTDLQERNARRKETIDVAQKRLFFAILFLLVSVAFYGVIEYDAHIQRKANATARSSSLDR